MNNIDLNIEVNASPEKIWQVLSNIEGAAERIECITDIEILEKPENGLLGLKWKETRLMFGREATEVMWITDVKENAYYTTRAENHGAIYTSKMYIDQQNGKTLVGMQFSAEVQTFMARIMGFLTGFIFKKATLKAIEKDLQDIKKAAEAL